jgi:hypothetical protein
VDLLVICKCIVLKLIYSEKATKSCEIFTLLLSYAGKEKISQNFVAFSEYMNFKCENMVHRTLFFTVAKFRQNLSVSSTALCCPVILSSKPEDMKASNIGMA